MDQQSENQDVDLEFFIELAGGNWPKFEIAIKHLAIPKKERHNYQLLTKELIKSSKEIDELKTKKKELETKLYENKAQVWQKYLKNKFRSISYFLFDLFSIGPRRDSSLRKF